jgi:pimeloyl-ACP methyl ester carboxylesterase
MIVANDTVLAYTESGPASGAPVIFSHLLLLGHNMFESPEALFSGRGFRGIAYDHRNQGRSAPDARKDHDMDTLTEDIASHIEQLRLAPCHFVGNSRRFVALRLVARRPGLLQTVRAAFLGRGRSARRGAPGLARCLRGQGIRRHSRDAHSSNVRRHHFGYVR